MWDWSESAWYAILLGAALKSTVVLGAARLAAWFLRKRPAAARHVVWTAAAAAILALPLLSVSLPAWRVPAAGAILPGDTGLVFHSDSAATREAATAPPLPGGEYPAKAAPWRPDARFLIMLIWAAGAAAAMGQMLLSLAAMRRLRRAARPFPDEGLCHSLARALGIRHGVEVLEMRHGSMPMTFGLLRPTVFMPADAAQWSEERRHMVLLHELAHVRRGDMGTHLIARAALSLYWWNPLAWSAWREFLKERERATDDLVLGAGARAAEYAGHLLEIARTMQSVPATAWAAVAMARRSQLEGRLLAILDTGVKRNAWGRVAATVAAVLAVVVVAPFAAIQARRQAAGAGSPELEATLRTATSQRNYDMLDRAAAAFESRGKYDEAQQLLEGALAIRGEVAGEASKEYQTGLVRLGDLLAQHTPQKAIPYYTQAVALGDTPEVANALLFLGMSKVQGSADYFQRALNVAGNGPAGGKALTWMGLIRQKEGGAAEAESLFTRALAMEVPESPDAATTMELYARMLRGQARADEAASFEARAAVIRKAHAAEVSPKLSQGPVQKVSRAQSGGVQAPVLIHKTEPQYTQEARAAKLSGTVLVYVEIGTDGKAYNMQITRGLGLGLDEAAIYAISQWQFQPGTRDGIPVPVQANVEINWRLM